MIKKAVFLNVLTAVILTAVFSGCTMFEPDNNYLHPVDFARKLQSDGLKVDAVRPLDPRPVAAAEAIELAIGNSNIGVYKYDINNKLQRKRLEKIKREKRIYFIGIPYPVYEVSGSFIVVGLDKHKEKKRILESLRNFK
ncbi:MAG: hypothetical protein E7043_00450 [Lentisphaerae bacterium]|nr:hypothetical protein [Lentisphaerota bacterium]